MPVQFPLVFSTLCQRLALGTYMMSLIAVYFLGVEFNLSAIALAALVVFCAGLLASLVHLGRPNRIMNSFANPQSHLTQEGILSPFVALFLFLQALDGWLIALNSALLVLVQVLAFLFSIAFIYSTGLVYQLFARPAWKSKMVGVNFFLSSLAIGSIGAYAWGALSGLDNVTSLLYLSAVTQILIILGQLYYSAYVRRLGYGVAINVLSGEFKMPYLGWVITGVVLPLALIAYAALSGGSGSIALALLLSALLGLVFWRMFFFLAGKHIKFFPQYESDLKTIF
ncbi:MULTISPECIES: DmsC/YnfH family molybdoenzyme membrane anchor subunit [Desulfitobacterium]|uniref:DMSO reductase anchor subunit n=1 Tax=Desulfitobacterium dehalogenans (strain ATCC 51507 / DSM 9161 / JW/IU-DC1) TaxID=756499 RepID=I4A7M1_DESDJ|nr:MULTISPECIES: DmsC/YnfH family molybdoenzyme membrane anchor subunit [Desulfitobacterium]AFL99955.1 DMSO reductase anchor subunit [Desulfitobacterium dehalogenans ATCC 51507]